MPIQVIAGPAFSGKARFVRQEIARREADGELGLVLLDYTALYQALTPGGQSQLRDERVSDTGAPRLAAFAYDNLLAAALTRELSGYITTNSARRAVDLADRIGAQSLFEVRASVDALAGRVNSHMAGMRGSVRRAAGAALRGRCAKAVATYLNESGALRDRNVRPVRDSGGRYEVGRSTTGSAYDGDAFVRGLTPAGRAARDALIAEGNPNPTPAEVFRRVLVSMGRR